MMQFRNILIDKGFRFFWKVLNGEILSKKRKDATTQRNLLVLVLITNVTALRRRIKKTGDRFRSPAQ
jgi:hypothetical protein